jgi:hypothetical protein
MGSLFVGHRARPWCPTNKEEREVNDPSYGCSAVAQYKTVSAGLSGVPACASTFPEIIKGLSYAIRLLYVYLDRRLIALGLLARFEVRLHLHRGSSLAHKVMASHQTTLLPS